MRPTFSNIVAGRVAIARKICKGGGEKLNEDENPETSNIKR